MCDFFKVFVKRVDWGDYIKIEFFYIFVKYGNVYNFFNFFIFFMIINVIYENWYWLVYFLIDNEFFFDCVFYVI